MNPLLIIAIPLGLVILGMILNSIGLSFDQPPSSPEQDPAKRVGGGKGILPQFFDLQRKRVCDKAETGRPVWLVAYGRHDRCLHLAVYGYREQDQPFESHCRTSNIGNGRRQTDGSLGDSERREQCQIPDQIAPSRQIGSRRKRRTLR